MYGIVNKAIQELVRSRFGENTWEVICAKAGFEEGEFISLKSYPDQLTFDILKVSSQELQIPEYDLMVLCGETWIEHTAASGYNNVLNLAGNNMVDFLYNLNIIHSRITHLMPEMRPPVFLVKRENTTGMVLQYQSERKGMEPLAIGILRGLGRRFGLSVDVKVLGADPDDSAFTLFEISW